MTELVVPIPLPSRLARLRNYAGPPPTAGAEPRPWFEFRNAAGDGDQGDTAELLIYDDIGDGGWFGGGVSATSFSSALRQITAPQLTVRLNSPGGDVFDGITIANLIRSHPANVTVAVDGLAASIASVIAMAGDKIIMGPQSQMMIHDAMGSVWGGNPADMRDMADLLDRQSDNIAAAYRAKAGGMAKSWRSRMQAETWYSADEAVAAGLADSVGTIPTAAGPASSTANPDEGYDDWWDRSTHVFDLAARYQFAGRAQAPSPDGLTTRNAFVGEQGPELVDLDQLRAVSRGGSGQILDAHQTLAAAGLDTDVPDADVPDAEPEPPVDMDDDQAPAEPQPDAPVDAQDPAADAQDDVVDTWASDLEHLTADPAAAWAADFAHLTGGV